MENITEFPILQRIFRNFQHLLRFAQSKNQYIVQLQVSQPFPAAVTAEKMNPAKQAPEGPHCPVSILIKFIFCVVHDGDPSFRNVLTIFCNFAMERFLAAKNIPTEICRNFAGLSAGFPLTEIELKGLKCYIFEPGLPLFHCQFQTILLPLPGPEILIADFQF